MSGITRDEWLAALKQATPADDPDVFTKNELGVMLGLKRTTMQERLKRLVLDGKAIRTTKRVTTTGGVQTSVAAYKLVKSEPVKRKR